MGQKYEIMCYFALSFPKKSTMNLELDLARRMARTADGARPSVMERIAVVAVAVSVAVMILALAVMMGFKREIAHKLGAMSSHIVVTDLRNTYAVDAEPIRRTAVLDSLLATQPSIERVIPYALRGGVLRVEEGVEGVVLKGVDHSYDQQTYAEWLVAGELPRIGDSIRTKDILLSRYLADRLRIEVGERVELLFVEGNQLPFRDRFKVAGIYSSGMEEMDRALVLTDLRNVQRLGLWDADEVTGLELRVAQFDRAPAVADAIDRALLYTDREGLENLTARSVQEIHPGIFAWLKTHDVNTAVVLIIMLIVAFFNMSTALLILLFERIRTIGILKALGMQHRSLRRLFRYRATMIALRGLAWGNAVGLALCWAQQAFELVKLDAEGYLLSAVPIAVEWGWWLLLNLGFVGAIYLMMLLPASVVATIKPDETMRYE